MLLEFQHEAQIFTPASQLPISHDDVFGDYTCVARNHLGSLRKVVTLAEGAKPGVPHVTVENIDQVQGDRSGCSLGAVNIKTRGEYL